MSATLAWGVFVPEAVLPQAVHRFATPLGVPIRYANVSMRWIRPLLEKVAATLGRIALAARLLGGFTVLVGIAILAGAVAATSLKCGGEAALLKSLGLTRLGVASLFAVEYGLLSLVARRTRQTDLVRLFRNG